MKKPVILYILFFCITALTNSQTANVTSHDFKESSKSKRYEVNMEYPQVDFGPGALMGLRGVAQDINACVDTLRQNQVNDFKYILGTLPKEPCAQQISMLELKYKTIYNNSNLFSFQFEVFSAPDCSNHPYNYYSTLNYSTTSVGAFGIGDIFVPSSGYLKYISDYTYNVLKQRAEKDGLLNSDELIKEGTMPLAENFRVFNVDEKNLTIVFNPYKAGPYIWGIQTVAIPLSGMKEMISANGPLGDLMK
ncbi:MAG: RsiV family protein [Ignavibacteria bacterium]|nr:RsiV family protein [Ignavibacteria bacterium]